MAAASLYLNFKVNVGGNRSALEGAGQEPKGGADADAPKRG